MAESGPDILAPGNRSSYSYRSKLGVIPSIFQWIYTYNHNSFSHCLSLVTLLVAHFWCHQEITMAKQFPIKAHQKLISLETASPTAEAFRASFNTFRRTLANKTPPWTHFQTVRFSKTTRFWSECPHCIKHCCLSRLPTMPHRKMFANARYKLPTEVFSTILKFIAD